MCALNTSFVFGRLVGLSLSVVLVGVVLEHAGFSIDNTSKITRNISSIPVELAVNEHTFSDNIQTRIFCNLSANTMGSVCAFFVEACGFVIPLALCIARRFELNFVKVD